MGGTVRLSLVRILYSLLASVGAYITLWHSADVLKDRLSSGARSGRSNYDFIVVGAGSAGSAVAYRLAQRYNVLLLEAGGDPYVLSHVPGFSLYLLNYPQIDWMHTTVPQRNACLALKNQESGWSQGKGLGGSSNINFMIHSRGHPKDYDNWARITGDPSWSYDGVLPYFKKMEDYHGEYSDSGLHGRGGPMRISLPPERGNADMFVNAGQDLGYEKVDLNGRFTQGFDSIYYFIKQGRRHGSYSAYIKPIRYKRTLTIEKFAQVNKILFNDKNEACGVEYERHGQMKQASATKEVIISAGAIQSPKILMLSGIGPREHLESLNIETKVDSPQVGQNLQDHISLYLGPFFVDPGHSIIPERDIKVSQFIEYFTRGTGPLTTTGIQAMGFFSTPIAQAEGEGDWPDIQLMYGGTGTYAEYPKHFAHGFGVREDILEDYHRNDLGKDSFFIITSLARPLQRGEILLKSSDPNEKLHIDPKYLQNEKDVRVLVEGVKRAVELAEKSRSFRQIRAKFTSQPFPGCERVLFRSDDYWECFIRHLSVTLHHIVGTCAMGANSSTSVVDTELKVRGVKNLRVIDASIMPTVPIGNTNSPAVMIGEKGADMILKQWSKTPPSPSKPIFDRYRPFTFTTLTTTRRPSIHSKQGRVHVSTVPGNFNGKPKISSISSAPSPIPASMENLDSLLNIKTLIDEVEASTLATAKIGTESNDGFPEDTTSRSRSDTDGIDWTDIDKSGMKVIESMRGKGQLSEATENLNMMVTLVNSNEASRNDSELFSMNMNGTLASSTESVFSSTFSDEREDENVGESTTSGIEKDRRFGAEYVDWDAVATTVGTGVDQSSSQDYVDDSFDIEHSFDAGREHGDDPIPSTAPSFLDFSSEDEGKRKTKEDRIIPSLHSSTASPITTVRTSLEMDPATTAIYDTADLNETTTKPSLASTPLKSDWEARNLTLPESKTTSMSLELTTQVPGTNESETVSPEEIIFGEDSSNRRNIFLLNLEKGADEDSTPIGSDAKRQNGSAGGNATEVSEGKAKVVEPSVTELIMKAEDIKIMGSENDPEKSRSLSIDASTAESSGTEPGIQEVATEASTPLKSSTESENQLESPTSSEKPVDTDLPNDSTTSTPEDAAVSTTLPDQSDSEVPTLGSNQEKSENPSAPSVNKSAEVSKEETPEEVISLTENTGLENSTTESSLTTLRTSEAEVSNSHEDVGSNAGKTSLESEAMQTTEGLPTETSGLVDGETILVQDSREEKSAGSASLKKQQKEATTSVPTTSRADLEATTYWPGISTPITDSSTTEAVGTTASEKDSLVNSAEIITESLSQNLNETRSSETTTEISASTESKPELTIVSTENAETQHPSSKQRFNSSSEKTSNGAEVHKIPEEQITSDFLSHAGTTVSEADAVLELTTPSSVLKSEQQEDLAPTILPSTTKTAPTSNVPAIDVTQATESIESMLESGMTTPEGIIFGEDSTKKNLIKTADLQRGDLDPEVTTASVLENESGTTNPDLPRYKGAQPDLWAQILRDRRITTESPQTLGPPMRDSTGEDMDDPEASTANVSSFGFELGNTTQEPLPEDATSGAQIMNETATEKSGFEIVPGENSTETQTTTEITGLLGNKEDPLISALENWKPAEGANDTEDASATTRRSFQVENELGSSIGSENEVEESTEYSETSKNETANLAAAGTEMPQTTLKSDRGRKIADTTESSRIGTTGIDWTTETTQDATTVAATLSEVTTLEIDGVTSQAPEVTSVTSSGSTATGTLTLETTTERETRDAGLNVTESTKGEDDTSTQSNPSKIHQNDTTNPLEGAVKTFPVPNPKIIAAPGIERVTTEREDIVLDEVTEELSTSRKPAPEDTTQEPSDDQIGTTAATNAKEAGAATSAGQDTSMQRTATDLIPDMFTTTPTVNAGKSSTDSTKEGRIDGSDDISTVETIITSTPATAQSATTSSVTSANRTTEGKILNGVEVLKISNALTTPTSYSRTGETTPMAISSDETMQAPSTISAVESSTSTGPSIFEDGGQKPGNDSEGDIKSTTPMFFDFFQQISNSAGKILNLQKQDDSSLPTDSPTTSTEVPLEIPAVPHVVRPATTTTTTSSLNTPAPPTTKQDGTTEQIPSTTESILLQLLKSTTRSEVLQDEPEDAQTTKSGSGSVLPDDPDVAFVLTTEVRKEIPTTNSPTMLEKISGTDQDVSEDHETKPTTQKVDDSTTELPKASNDATVTPVQDDSLERESTMKPREGKSFGEVSLRGLEATTEISLTTTPLTSDDAIDGSTTSQATATDGSKSRTLFSSSPSFIVEDSTDKNVRKAIDVGINEVPDERSDVSDRDSETDDELTTTSGRTSREPQSSERTSGKPSENSEGTSGEPSTTSSKSKDETTTEIDLNPTTVTGEYGAAVENSTGKTGKTPNDSDSTPTVTEEKNQAGARTISMDSTLEATIEPFEMPTGTPQKSPQTTPKSRLQLDKIILSSLMSSSEPPSEDMAMYDVDVTLPEPDFPAAAADLIEKEVQSISKEQSRTEKAVSKTLISKSEQISDDFPMYDVEVTIPQPDPAPAESVDLIEKEMHTISKVQSRTEKAISVEKVIVSKSEYPTDKPDHVFYDVMVNVSQPDFTDYSAEIIDVDSGRKKQIRVLNLSKATATTAPSVNQITENTPAATSADASGVKSSEALSTEGSPLKSTEAPSGEENKAMPSVASITVAQGQGTENPSQVSSAGTSAKPTESEVNAENSFLTTAPPSKLFEETAESNYPPKKLSNLRSNPNLGRVDASIEATTISAEGSSQEDETSAGGAATTDAPGRTESPDSLKVFDETGTEMTGLMSDIDTTSKIQVSSEASSQRSQNSEDAPAITEETTTSKEATTTFPGLESSTKTGPLDETQDVVESDSAVTETAMLGASSIMESVVNYVREKVTKFGQGIGFQKSSSDSADADTTTELPGTTELPTEESTTFDLKMDSEGIKSKSHDDITDESHSTQETTTLSITEAPTTDPVSEFVTEKSIRTSSKSPAVFTDVEVGVLTDHRSHSRSLTHSSEVYAKMRLLNSQSDGDTTVKSSEDVTANSTPEDPLLNSEEVTEKVGKFEKTESDIGIFSSAGKTEASVSSERAQNLMRGEASTVDSLAAIATMAPAASETTTAPAASETSSAPAASETTTAPAAAEITTAPAASESATASETTTAPAATEITTAPAASETTIAPAASKTKIAAAPSETTIAAAPSETTIAAAPSETTIAAAPSETTIAAAAAETTIAAAAAETATAAAAAETATAAAAPETTIAEAAPETTIAAAAPETTIAAAAAETTTAPEATIAAAAPETTTAPAAPESAAAPTTATKTTSSSTSSTTSPTTTTTSTTTESTTPSFIAYGAGRVRHQGARSFVLNVKEVYTSAIDSSVLLQRSNGKTTETPEAVSIAQTSTNNIELSSSTSTESTLVEETTVQAVEEELFERENFVEAEAEAATQNIEEDPILPDEPVAQPDRSLRRKYFPATSAAYNLKASQFSFPIVVMVVHIAAAWGH